MRIETVRECLRWLGMALLTPPVCAYAIARAALNHFAVRHASVPKCQSRKFDIVYLTGKNENATRPRNRALMQALSHNRRVLYCRSQYIHDACREPFELYWHRMQQIGNLLDLKILLVPGGQSFAAIRQLNRFIMRAKIKRLLSAYGFKKIVLCSGDDAALSLRGQLGEILNFPEIDEALCLKKGGVDFDRFFSSLPSVCPPDIERIDPPILGCVGTIDDRIDLDLLHNLAQRREDWNIVLIGPRRRDLSDVLSMKNVHYLGEKEDDALPFYLRQFDACLTPLASNRTIGQLEASTILEYFAAAKPVVCTAVEGLDAELKKAMGVAQSSDDFLRLCENAIGDKFEFDLDAGIQLARSRSWERLASEFESAIHKAHQEKVEKS